MNHSTIETTIVNMLRGFHTAVTSALVTPRVVHTIFVALYPTNALEAQETKSQLNTTLLTSKH